MSQRMVSTAEYKAVAGVVAEYIEALRIGSVEMLDGLFHANAVTYGTVDGGLVGGGTTNPAADFIRNYGKSPDIEAHIDVLDMTPTTAVVRVLIAKDAVGSDCTDTLLLIKLDGRWKVIAKVFHQFDVPSS
ncbi:MAG: nuclear transport factor 2 family protein [Planctomycetaceae bacterium]|nr:nuclear transport factor 2 family protein [Planctomycetaceae bacterium]